MDKNEQLHYDNYKIDCHVELLEYKVFELKKIHNKVCKNIKHLKFQIARLNSQKKTLNNIKE